MVNNIVTYDPDSKVFLCASNFLGSWHDESHTANILPYIHKKIGSLKMCVYQGFPRGGDAALFLLVQWATDKHDLLQIFSLT